MLNNNLKVLLVVGLILYTGIRNGVRVHWWFVCDRKRDLVVVGYGRVVHKRCIIDNVYVSFYVWRNLVVSSK